MKSIVRLIVMALVLIPAISNAQQSKAHQWPEMKAFHNFMSGSFHPAEDGNFKPLRQNADSMMIAAKAWQASSIPDSYKPDETKAALEKLVKQTAEIAEAVKAKTSDEKLKIMISNAHDTFHTIVGECRKKEQ